MARRRTRRRQGDQSARFPVAMVVVALILLIQSFSFFFTAITTLFSLGVMGSRIAAQFIGGGTLTPAGREVAVSGLMLVSGVVALGILVGFLLRKRWAWTAGMTWAAIALGFNLINYFRGEPQYLSMATGVALMLALNTMVVRRSFYGNDSWST